MTTEAQVRSWAAQGESETQEFKETTGLRVEACQTLCGFLNRNGGRVLFGVTNAGEVRGQDVTEATLEKIAGETQRLDPPAFPEVERVPLENGREVVIVTIGRGSQRPYSFKGQKYIRVGATTTTLSEEEANRMLLERLHGTTRWENEVAVGYTLDDLEYPQIVQTLEESIRRGRSEDPGTRDPLEILRGFGLLARGSNDLLKAAIVLFAKSDRLLPDFAQCLLRVARFRGVDKSEFLDNRRFEGNAFSLLRLAERFLIENLPVAGRVLPGLFERVDDPLYPREALREALANAFCHRDYSIGGGSVGLAIFDDRLEITSSGTLHFGLTPEDLFRPHESLPWNPIIASVFYRRGIVESFGRGTLKMAELLEGAGLPKPDIESVAGAVTVRFVPSRYVPPQRVQHDLTDHQRIILEILAPGAPMMLKDIHALTRDDVPLRRTRDDLALLRELELVGQRGHGVGSRWFMKNGRK